MDPDHDAIEPSGGNVFADLAIDEPDDLMARAEIVARIGSIIDERGLSRPVAAGLLGLDPAELAGLLRGQFDGFPVPRLFRFLNALGQDVEIVIRPERRSGSAETRVVIA